MKIEEKSKGDYPEFVNGIPLGEILRAIASLQFGNVTVFVQDSKVIQIERTEKKRLLRKSESDWTI
jgi:hypothetical protein